MHPETAFLRSLRNQVNKGISKKASGRKLTRYKTIFFKFSSFNRKVNKPTREIKLTTNTLTRL